MPARREPGAGKGKPLGVSLSDYETPTLEAELDVEPADGLSDIIGHGPPVLQVKSSIYGVKRPKSLLSD